MVEPISQQDLLDEIHRLANDLGKTPTTTDLRKHGRYSIRGYYTHFDGWSDALEEAGFTPNRGYSVSSEELVEEIHKVAKKVDGTPTRNEVAELGRCSANPYYRVFDNWNEALEVAGYEANQHNASRNELLEEIQRLAVDRKPPTKTEMEMNGKYSAQAYYSEFDSWSNAVEEAGFKLRRLRNGNRREYDYGEGWSEETREAIRERDGRRCQHNGCTITSKEHWELFGERLHVHHLVPANDFEIGKRRNDPRNLISLCRLHHRTWEAADDYCPLDQSLPEECNPAALDPYMDGITAEER